MEVTVQVAEDGDHAESAAGTGWSVRAHLLGLVLVAVIIVGAGSAYVFSWSLDHAEDDALERLRFQSNRAAESIGESIDGFERAVAAVASQPGLDAAFAAPSACTLTLDGSGAFPDVRMDVVSADGVVACTSGDFPTPRTAAVHAAAPWLVEALASTSTRITPDSFDAVAQQRSMAITAPVPAGNASAAAAGAVVVFLHHAPAGAAMTREFGGSPDVRFALVDRVDGDVVSSSGDIGRTSSTGSLRGSGMTGRMTASDGSSLVVGFADVADADWRVIAALPQEKVFGEARGALVRQVSLGVLALTVLVAGVWLLNRRIAQPLRAVTEAVKQASHDPTAAHVREAGTAETVALARSFNAMLDIRAGHEAQLAHQATHDSLTGLPNKALLVRRLERALAAGKPVAVISLGVDRFRKINDALGHEAGDRLLREIAERLSQALREGDTLARSEGDHLIMLCEDVEFEAAVDITARTQQTLAVPFRGPLGDVTVTVTAGIATGAGAATTSGRLLREADTAEHEAKRHSRSYHIYDETMQTRATAHLTIQRDLARALERDQLVVYYQPILDLRTGAIVGAEALVRWQHPERGLVPPNDFIPVAEQTGQILAIGELVLNRACQQAARWAVAGHRLTMSVNVAPAQLRHGDFVILVERALAASGVQPSWLCVEITESSLMARSAQLDDDLAQLREMGVHLALDDFGTGYSSLSSLQQVPCDELKIDRSFVSRLDHDGRDLHLVSAIVGMARALGLTVVAEGVETEQQREVLAGLGCQQAQGYLFSPPVPEAAFAALLANPSSMAFAGPRVRAV